MNRVFHSSLALVCAAFPVFAQQPLAQLLEQASAAPAAGVSAERSNAFSALASLPADTDSFLALQNLGRLGMVAGKIAGAGQSGLVSGMAASLDSFALGVSREASEDLVRLAPLFALLGEDAGYLDAWLAQAQPEAARAIVAVQRMTQEERGARLVELTQNLKMAPIYMVLTARPEGRALLQQASLLPLMIPVAPGGPVELTAQGAWRGLCLKGNLLDLSEAGLNPEHEELLKQNLENLRIYVVTRVVGSQLQLAITSDLSLVQLPAKAGASLLSSDKMAAFGSFQGKNPWAVGYTSPELVNLSSRIDMSGYLGVARVVKGVMQQLGKQNEVCARAAASLEKLMGQADALSQTVKHAEQFMVWQEGESWYVRAVTDARGLEFSPGILSCQPLSRAEDTIFVAETTPACISGEELPELSSLFDDLTSVLQGCRETLQPEHAAGVETQLQQLAGFRPSAEKLSAGARLLGQALSGSATVLLQQLPAEAEHPVRFSLRAGVADAAALAEAMPLLREGVNELCEGVASISLQYDAQTLKLDSSAAGAADLPAAEPVPVQGGAVFSLQLAPLSRSLQQASTTCPDSGIRDAAAVAEMAATAVERVDGAATTADGKLYLMLRVQPESN